MTNTPRPGSRLPNRHTAVSAGGGQRIRRWRPRRTRSGFALAACWGALFGAFLLEGCADDPTVPHYIDPSVAAGSGRQDAVVVIEPHWLTLDRIGANGTLTARVTDADGNTVVAPQVMWASTDTAVATVSGAGSGVGRVRASGFGTTKVTATYNSTTAEATVEVALPLTDREILEIFYEATGGDSWTDNTNWLSDKDLSEWHGVSAHQGKVSELRLWDNNLVGPIPPELGTHLPV